MSQIIEVVFLLEWPSHLSAVHFDRSVQPTPPSDTVGTFKWVETVLPLTTRCSLCSAFGKERGCQPRCWMSDCAVLCLSFQTLNDENYGAILVLNLSRMYWWGCMMMKWSPLLRKAPFISPPCARRRAAEVIELQSRFYASPSDTDIFQKPISERSVLILFPAGTSLS